MKTETLSQEFKSDLKKEIEKFKNVTKQEKKDSSSSSDAVQNLIKEGGAKGNVIIFNNSNDTYKKDAEKILKELREREKKAEEESIIQRQEFAKGVKKQF